MIDKTKRMQKEALKERTRRRMHAAIDEDNYEYIPAEKQAYYYDNDVHQRVAIYARVSTGDQRQTTSFELQQIYYEDFVNRHPNWTLVKIYADEHVIIGTSGENLVKSRGSALVPISFLLRDKPKSFKSLKIINERL